MEWTLEYIKVEIYIPEEYVVELANELNENGILLEGNYDYSFSTMSSIGHWRPLEGADPFDGEIGVVSSKEEIKMEFRIRAEDKEEVRRIVDRVHPYETQVMNFIPLLNEK